MKVLVTGSSGMIGSLVINECLDNPDIEQVISVVRRKTQATNSKLLEVVHDDFCHWQSFDLSDIDAVIYCLGVYTGTVANEAFKQITLDMPVSLATELSKQNPKGKFILLSGQGADRKEKSKMAFARYKGMAENRIASLNLKQFTSFRPGYIYPVVVRKEPNFGYRLSRKLYPLVKVLGSKFSITSEQLAKAMVSTVVYGEGQQVLENASILQKLK